MLSVTAIGAAKIYLTYRDRLYSLYKPDWTYPIDYCINHIENNVAIIVANIPILRGLVTRWTFNFGPKSRPTPQRVIRSDRHWRGSHTSGFSSFRKKRSLAKKFLPWIRADFSSSLATRSSGPATGNGSLDKQLKSHQRTIIAETEINWTYNSMRAQKGGPEQFEMAASCEKGEARETRQSTMSRGSVASFVGGGVMGLKNLDSPPVSPVRPLSPVMLRGRAVDEDEVCLNP